MRIKRENGQCTVNQLTLAQVKEIRGIVLSADPELTFKDFGGGVEFYGDVSAQKIIERLGKLVFYRKLLLAIDRQVKLDRSTATLKDKRLIAFEQVVRKGTWFTDTITYKHNWVRQDLFNNVYKVADALGFSEALADRKTIPSVGVWVFDYEKVERLGSSYSNKEKEKFEEILKIAAEVGVSINLVEVIR